MTPYDMAMVAVIVAGMIWGAWRGITWQLASILSLGLGYAVAVPVSAQLAPQFPGQPIVARALAMLVLYVAVSAGVFGVAWSIRATLRRLKFEAYDRHLGMLLGGIEGAILGIVATVFVVSLAPQSRTPILTSRAGQAVDHTLKLAQPALPDELRTILQPYWDALDRGTPQDVMPNWEMATDASQDQPGREVLRLDPKSDPDLLRSMFDRAGAEAGKAFADQLQGDWSGASGPSHERNPRR
ncbi:CvpA family protein [Tautonia rosea]|uniref:CvpA family protein n=1 Tax=Tautonia rosea TaxID=2728037 RepID=UPI0014751996|nr:CvpA family protein [Tautonia rosea]